jgi:hemoglobin-like flavoprotein
VTDIDAADIKEIRMSYGRCIAISDFFDQFYDRFLISHPDIRKKFENTDFVKQKDLIKHGVNMMIGFADNNPIAIRVLTRIRDSHRRDNLNIDPHYYRYWLDSLLKTISENDSKLDKNLTEVWRKVLAKGIEFISSGYLVTKTA